MSSPRFHPPPTHSPPHTRHTHNTRILSLSLSSRSVQFIMFRGRRREQTGIFLPLLKSPSHLCKLPATFIKERSGLAAGPGQLVTLSLLLGSLLSGSRRLSSHNVLSFLLSLGLLSLMVPGLCNLKMSLLVLGLFNFEMSLILSGLFNAEMLFVV